MKVLICTDSFKGTFSSRSAGELIKDVFNASGFTCEVIPVADGGEGTVEAIAYSTKAKLIKVESVDVFGREIESEVALNGSTAILEAASCIGITQLKQSELNPLRASSAGLGMLINKVIARNCRNLIIGIGGTATNDIGLGMLGELGFKICDKNGDQLKPYFDYGYTASDLGFVSDIVPRTETDLISIKVLSDVKNPLTGEHGATFVYGSQKGASQTVINILDHELSRISKCLNEKYSYKDNFPGAGAAGGLGYAFKNFLNAEIISGIEGVMKLIGLKDKLANSDIVIVGEGSMDKQSAYGKAPVGISKLAKNLGKTVYAITGVATQDAVSVFDKGIDAIFSAFKPENKPVSNELKNFAGKYLRATTKLLVEYMNSNIDFENRIIYLK